MKDAGYGRKQEGLDKQGRCVLMLKMDAYC